MKTKTQKLPVFKELPKDYTGLCQVLMPRPINTEAECDEAYELAAMMAGHKLTKDQGDYMEALSIFVIAYDEEHHPEPDDDLPTHELLQYLCNENGMSGADFGRLLGVDRTLATRILRGERNLTVAHIRKVCERFKLKADSFING